MKKIKQFLTFVGYITSSGRIDKKEIAIDAVIIGGGLVIITIVYKIIKMKAGL